MSGWYLVLLWFLCVVVFVTDWLFRRVPNRVLIGVSLLYLGIRLIDSAGLSVGNSITWSASMSGALIAFVFLLPFYVFRAMGAGDVKFFAVIGLLLGPIGAAGVWLFGTALTGLHAVLQLVCTSYSIPGVASLRYALGRLIAREDAHLQRVAAWIRARRQGRRGIPYAAYMAIAALSHPVWIDARI